MANVSINIHFLDKTPMRLFLTVTMMTSKLLILLVRRLKNTKLVMYFTIFSCFYINHIDRCYKISVYYILAQFYLYISGAFYFTLGNLSPQYRSVINIIQLVALCRVPLINKYGMNRILQPFMQDIHELESVSLH